MNILVTGASGFIGAALCRELLARGHAVRAAVRSADAALPAQVQRIVVGDIAGEFDARALLEGVEALVHLAAIAHRAGSDKAEIYRVNVEGSENLARQAARVGVRRFVFLSSVKVHGEASARRAFVETDPVMPMDAYGLSKAEAERRLRIVSTGTGMEVVVVRPPLVYGPGVKANFLSLLRAVDAGIPLPLSSVSNLRSLVYVGNLVHALSACLTHPAAANRTFFVSDDHDVSTPQLVREIAAALGEKPLLFPFSPPLLRALGQLTGHAEQIGRLTGSLQVDISRIKSELGWRPPFTMRDGLAETARWYRLLRS